MSLAGLSQKSKSEDSDSSSDNLNHDVGRSEDDDIGELTDDSEKKSKAHVDFNCFLTNILTNKQSTAKKDKLLKLNNQSYECDNERSVLENYPKSSPIWKLNDGSLEEDVYTIGASGHSTSSPSLQITSIDGFFNRKRGRPPKNRFVEVYKNTHQKPQAIFTSFKLEKQAANCENSITNCLQNDADSLWVCDSDNNPSGEYSGHKPLHINSTLPKRFCSKVNLSTNSLKEQCKPAHEKANEDCDDGCNGTLKSISMDSGPALKKPKASITTKNVTVIRAAGTFYPENSNENESSKAGNNFKEKLSDLEKEKPSILCYEEKAAQNLSVREETLLVSSTAASSKVASQSTHLPHAYNVLQMQQQLFAFYQQLALMAPALLSPTFTQTNAATNLTRAAPSRLTSIDNNHQHLLNIILNLQKHQANQESTSELITGGKTRARQFNKKTTTKLNTANFTSTTATTAQVNKQSQVNAALFDISAEKHLASDKQFQDNGEHSSSGYLRFHFSKDCGSKKCIYRFHQSHFHCSRADCKYSFCDKTRFAQHTARHERLDILMGSDFQQYRGKMTCSNANCPYAFSEANNLNHILNSRRSTHFHCLKCPFVCIDTNKVVAHRRWHSKMEFLRLAGFRKVTYDENCMVSNSTADANINQQYSNVNPPPDNLGDHKPLDENPTACSQSIFKIALHCPYAMRYTHYHCLVCNCSVLSRSHLMAHKHRHTSILLSTMTPPPPSNQS